MKLYVIGTSPQANIHLKSPYASGYHAELLLLDNGDIILTDRGSKNGTYVNGKKIVPDKDVAVRRDDKVTFADENLDWSRIPTNTVDMSKVKEIRSIGSHHLNRILLQGEHVSRFHATMKRMADGKWYIQDHSKNGTTINGNRIPKDQDVRIKRGDKILCAGQMVQNPLPAGPNWGIIGGVAGAVAACALIIYLIIPKPDYVNSVALVQGYYHYEVMLDDQVIDKTDVMSYEGTGFFVSDDGKLVTNLHIAKPWLFEDVSEQIKNAFLAEWKKQAMTGVKLARTYSELSAAATLDALTNNIKVVGVLDKVRVYPNGNVYAEQNAIDATVVATSSNTEVDIAVMQLVTQKLPERATYVKRSNISQDPNDAKVRTELFVVGFPQGRNLQLSGDNVSNNNRIMLEAYRTEGTVIRSGNDVNFEHNAMTEGGSSGSPVFDKKGRLIGVNAAHWGTSKDNNFNIAIDASLIHGLLNKPIDY